jgi:hypothetical protein
LNPIRMAAVSTVTLALILYGIGTFKEQRGHRSTAAVRGFLSAGLTFDVIATMLMIMATGSVAPTIHGWLGYSALALMAVDVSLMWRHWRRNGDAPIPAGQHLFARLAYAYWIVAYFAGAALVMAAKHAKP